MKKNYITITDKKMLNKLACEAWNMPYADEDGRIKWFEVQVEFEVDEDVCNECGEDIDSLSWEYCPYCGESIERNDCYFIGENLEEVLNMYAKEKGLSKKEMEQQIEEILEKATITIRVREDLYEKVNNKMG